MELEKMLKQYNKGVDYKTTNNLYTDVANNEDFYSSKQWKGVKANLTDKPTLNFMEQIIDTKVSTVMAEEIMIFRLADELSLDNPDVQTAVDAFTKSDEVNWDRVGMADMNERLLLDSSLSGLGVSFWFWDNDIKTGNDFVNKGDFKGELVDSVNLTVANPSETSIQKQDWIMIDSQKTVNQVKKIAKDAGLDEEEVESIRSDASNKRHGDFSKQEDNEFNRFHENGLVTVIIKLYKKDGKVHFTKFTRDIILQDETNTKLDRFPVAIMPWKLRKRYIYGTAEITDILNNQKYINKMQSLRQLHTMLMSAPKLVYDKNKVRGITNRIGGQIGVNGDVSGVLQYVQPKQMSIDVDKAVADMIQLTREFKGLNDNVLGISRPENTSALLAQQRASTVPLETVKRRFYSYLEEVALIWLDFYKNKYNMTRKLARPEKNEILEFTGTDYKDVYLKTSLDIGASTQYSELASIETLDKLLAGGHITITQYLARYPKNIIPKQEELIEELGGGGDIAKQFKFEMMAKFLESIDDQARARLMNLPEEQREQAIMQAALQQSEEQPTEPVGVSPTRSNPEQANLQAQRQQQINAQQGM